MIRNGSVRERDRREHEPVRGNHPTDHARARGLREKPREEITQAPWLRAEPDGGGDREVDREFVEQRPGVLEVHESRVEERHRPHEHHGGQAAHREEVRHALERQQRDGEKTEEKVHAVLPEIRRRKVPDLVKEPGRTRGKNDVGRRLRAGETLEDRGAASAVEQQRQPQREQQESGDEVGGGEAH